MNGLNMKKIYAYLKWKIKKFFHIKNNNTIDVHPVINVFVDLLTTEELNTIRNALESDFLNTSIPDKLSGMRESPEAFLKKFSSDENYIATYTQIAAKLVTASAICGDRSIFRDIAESVSELSDDIVYLNFIDIDTDEFSLSVKSNVLMDIFVFLTLMGGYLYTVINEKLQDKKEMVSGIVKPLNG
jgi:hypothetical protein